MGRLQHNANNQQNTYGRMVLSAAHADREVEARVQGCFGGSSTTGKQLQWPALLLS